MICSFSDLLDSVLASCHLPKYRLVAVPVPAKHKDPLQWGKITRIRD